MISCWPLLAQSFHLFYVNFSFIYFMSILTESFFLLRIFFYLLYVVVTGCNSKFQQIHRNSHHQAANRFNILFRSVHTQLDPVMSQCQIVFFIAAGVYMCLQWMLNILWDFIIYLVQPNDKERHEWNNLLNDAPAARSRHSSNQL